MKKKLLAISSMLGTWIVTATAFAQDSAMSNEFDKSMGVAIAAGLGIGIAAAGGSIGQGRAASAALEGIARNPNAYDKLFTPMILGLALIESLVIYALVVSLILLFSY
ncbi:MAG: ATP synthase F0 subunit C [Sandaracinaceae bacterium]